jgi:hypothetical protein
MNYEIGKKFILFDVKTRFSVTQSIHVTSETDGIALHYYKIITKSQYEANKFS